MAKQQYLTYDNFSALTFEKRQNLDPGIQMIEDYRRKATSLLAQASHPTTAKDMSQLEDYLEKISIDDLLLLKKPFKSSKQLEDGPF